MPNKRVAVLHLSRYAAPNPLPFAMPTTKPRVSVTLSPRLHACLAEMALHTGNSQSALIGELLGQSLPTFERMVKVFRAAAQAKATVGEVMAESIGAAHHRIEELLNLEDVLSPEDLGQLSLLERVESVERRAAAMPPAAKRGGVSDARASQNPPLLTGGSGTPKRSASSKTKTRVKGVRNAPL